jgi:hypothetical protein
MILMPAGDRWRCGLYRLSGDAYARGWTPAGVQLWRTANGFRDDCHLAIATNGRLQCETCGVEVSKIEEDDKGCEECVTVTVAGESVERRLDGAADAIR